MSKNIAFEIVDKTGILVHDRNEPEPDQWNQFMQGYREDVLGKKLKQLVVFSEGGAPTHTQRDVFTKLNAASKISAIVIVVDPEVFIATGRGVITAMDWIGSLQAPTYEPPQLEQALVDLGIKNTGPVNDGIRRLREQIQGAAAA